jgi:uncharacterized protein YbcI
VDGFTFYNANGIAMIEAHLNRAQLEYTVMLAVLNVQTEFMKSHYNRAQVRLLEDLIEVTLTRATAIPAEDRLAQTVEGRALLWQVHTSLFMAGESLLRERLERDLGLKVRDLFSHLDSVAGKCTIIIRLMEGFNRHPVGVGP